MFPIAQYIPFTEEQKLRAGAVDLEEFLRTRGERLIKSGRDKRLESDHSVTVRGSSWYDHAAERGGGPVSFLQRFYRMSYPEAMQTLLGGDGGRAYPAAREREPEPAKAFALPKANLNMRRVFAYLMKQRGIDKDVVSHFAREELLYEDAEHHNCVFVGTDENGIPRHAHKRSTNSFGSAFRINVEGSDPRHSFHHIGRTGCLLAFEAPIDMMSYLTMRRISGRSIAMSRVAARRSCPSRRCWSGCRAWIPFSSASTTTARAMRQANGLPRSLRYRAWRPSGSSRSARIGTRTWWSRARRRR